MKIKVKANRHVVGLKRGEVGWVEDSKKVQSLIRVGYLVRVKEKTVRWAGVRAGLDVDEEALAEQREYADKVIEEYGPESTKLVDYDPSYFREPVSDDFGLTYNIDPDLQEFDAAMAEEGANIPWEKIDPDES